MKLSLPVQILIGLVLGIGAGFFFGEYTRFLTPIGQGFVMLLKMSVLPYITLALIHGIGSLTPMNAKRLVKYGAAFLVLIWFVTIAAIYIYSLAYPPRSVAAIYPIAPRDPAESLPILELFIPSNPFYALANNLIPAIVIFSVFFGIALMFISAKENFLSLLETAIGALTRIIQAVIRVSPYGIFALIASSTGTMTFHQFEKLEAYLVVFIALSLFLSLWAMPILVTSFTRLKYGQLMREMRAPLLLAFATGNIFVSLPYIINSISALLEGEEGPETRDARALGRTLAPIAYNLPLVGNLMAMAVILFLGYFYAIDFTFLQQVQVVIASLFTLVGPVAAGYNAVSFLLDAMHLPHEGLAIFVETSAITRNLQGLAGSMGIASFTLLTVFAFTHQLRFRIPKLAINGALTILILGASAWGVALITPDAKPLPPPYPHLQIAQRVPTKVYRTGEPLPPPREAGEPLEQILKSGELRVGYFPDALPFSYFNDKDELVGFDIAMAHQLAHDLGVALTFVPFEFDEIADGFEKNHYDIVMSATDVTIPRLERMRFSNPVMKVNGALIVPDHQRDQFRDLREIQRRSGLRIGVLKGSSWEPVAQATFPKAEIIEVEKIEPGLDVYLTSDQAAIPEVVANPQLTVVVPSPPIEQRLRAYPVDASAERWEEFVNYWLRLQEVDGNIEAAHRKWIEGKSETKPKRWSVMRNVLHLVD